MDKETKIYLLARTLFAENHPNDAFSVQAPRVQANYMDLARERLIQQEAMNEAKRDEDAKQDRLDSLLKRIADGLTGEKSYFLAVYTGCTDIPFALVKQYITSESLMLLYYSETSVEKAVAMVHTMHENIKDKMAVINAQKPKG